MRTVDEWKTLLRTALRDAQRARDGEAMAVLREALATIDNAEAPDVSHAPSGDTGPIAGAVQGLGAGEIARRVLGPDEVTAIIAREMTERRDAAATYVALGRPAEAETLERQARVLEALLAG